VPLWSSGHYIIL